MCTLTVAYLSTCSVNSGHGASEQKIICETSNMLWSYYRIPSEFQNTNIESGKHENQSESEESEDVHQYLYLYFSEL